MFGAYIALIVLPLVIIGISVIVFYISKTDAVLNPAEKNGEGR
jgi:hypothetical protein